MPRQVSLTVGAVAMLASERRERTHAAALDPRNLRRAAGESRRPATCCRGAATETP